MKTEDLYKTVILAHNDKPVNFFKQPDAAFVLEAYNQFCGDQFQLYFSIAAGKLQGVSFHGYGCAISKASTSVLVSLLEGKELAAAQALIRDFQAMIHSGQPLLPQEELRAFEAARHFPGRQQCASLSWDELGAWLKGMKE